MMTGVYASKEEAKKKGNKINNVGWWFKPWFYQHAQTALKRGEFVEYIPTREYYHRHTRCLYWEGKLILPFGDQFWFRFLLGWLMPPKVSLLKATQGEAIRNYYHDNHVIQDMLVPLYKVGDALEFVHREMEVCGLVTGYYCCISISLPCIIMLTIHSSIYVATGVSTVAVPSPSVQAACEDDGVP
jgi:delta24-sterol reductase